MDKFKELEPQPNLNNLNVTKINSTSNATATNVALTNEMKTIELLLPKMTLQKFKMILNDLWQRSIEFRKVYFIDENINYVYENLWRFVNPKGHFEFFKKVLKRSKTSKYPLYFIIEDYKRKIRSEFKFMTDAEYRIQYLEFKRLDALEKFKINQTLFLREQEFDCRIFLQEVYKTEHPVKYWIHITYLKCLRYLAKNTLLKLGLFIFTFISIHGYFENKLINLYMRKYAYARNKLPKFKYLGITGKKIQKLVTNSVSEVQIGLGKKQLEDLYKFPVKKRIYITAPENYYPRKQLQAAKPIINSLYKLKYKKYNTYEFTK